MNSHFRFKLLRRGSQELRVSGIPLPASRILRGFFRSPKKTRDLRLDASQIVPLRRKNLTNSPFEGRQLFARPAVRPELFSGREKQNDVRPLLKISFMNYVASRVSG